MERFEAKLSSKGQLTLPVELRREWSLKEGDTVAFVRSASGEVTVVSRNVPASAIFGMLSHLQSDPAYLTDDDAIADQVAADDEATKSTHRKSRAA